MPALLACLIPVCAFAASDSPPDTGFSPGISIEPPSDANTQNDRPGNTEPTTPWWQSRAQNSSLTIRYAGAYAEAPGEEPAIALLFSQALPSGGGYNAHLAVYDPDTRKQVPGRWQLADDPHMLYFLVPESGTYLVRVRAGLEDRGGHTLNQSVSGPIPVP